MSIRKRKLKDGAVSWGYYFDAPGSTREDRKTIIESGFATRKEAEQAEARRRLELEEEARLAEGLVAGAPKTLAGLFEEYMREHVKPNLALTSQQSYERHSGYLSKEILEMPLQKLTPLILTKEWNRLAQSGSKKQRWFGNHLHNLPLDRGSVGNVKRIVSGALSWAAKMGILTSNPAQYSVVPGGRGKAEPQIASMAQVGLLIASAPEDLAEFMEVCVALGARRGEVLALKWPDIDGNRVRIERSLAPLKGGAIFKGTKSGKKRFVTIGPSTLEVLERIRVRQVRLKEQLGPDYKNHDLVFCSPEGMPLNPVYVSCRIGRLCRKLKLEGVKLHTLRHTHASELLADGMEVPAVSKRLGHASSQVTMAIYAHMVVGRDEEASDSWERKWKAAKKAVFDRSTGEKPDESATARDSTRQHHGEKDTESGENGGTGTTKNQRVRVN